MFKAVVGYGAHRTQHKGTRRWFTAPILEGEPIDRFEKVWYGPDAKELAWEWVKEKTGRKEREDQLVA